MDSLEADLERLRKKNGVFNSKGWALIQEDLISFWQLGDQALRSRKASNMQDIEFIRGQMVAMEYLLNLAETTKQKYDMTRQQQEQLKQIAQ